MLLTFHSVFKLLMWIFLGVFCAVCTVDLAIASGDVVAVVAEENTHEGSRITSGAFSSSFLRGSSEVSASTTVKQEDEPEFEDAMDDVDWEIHNAEEAMANQMLVQALVEEVQRREPAVKAAQEAQVQQTQEAEATQEDEASDFADAMDDEAHLEEDMRDGLTYEDCREELTKWETLRQEGVVSFLRAVFKPLIDFFNGVAEKKRNFDACASRQPFDNPTHRKKAAAVELATRAAVDRGLDEASALGKSLADTYVRRSIRQACGLPVVPLPEAPLRQEGEFGIPEAGEVALDAAMSQLHDRLVQPLKDSYLEDRKWAIGKVSEAASAIGARGSKVLGVGKAALSRVRCSRRRTGNPAGLPEMESELVSQQGDSAAISNTVEEVGISSMVASSSTQ